MAGIGFELKKLFSNSSIIMKLRANLFSSVVIAGPMIMGAILLLGIKYLAVRAGDPQVVDDNVGTRVAADDGGRLGQQVALYLLAAEREDHGSHTSIPLAVLRETRYQRGMIGSGRRCVKG